MMVRIQAGIGLSSTSHASRLLRGSLATQTNWRAARPANYPARWLNAGLGRPDRIQELANLGLEACAIAGQHLRRRQDLRGSRAGLARAALHVGDVGRHLLGALRRLLHVPGDFLGGCALL